MGSLKKQIEEKIKKLTPEVIASRQQDFVDEIEYSINDFNRFLNKNYNAIKDVLSSIDELDLFNEMNDTNLNLDVKDLFTIEWKEDGFTTIRFFNYEDVEFSINLFERTLFPTLKIKDVKYNIRMFDEEEREELLYSLKGLEHIDTKLYEYYCELNERLRKHSEDGDLEKIFERLIERL